MSTLFRDPRWATDETNIVDPGLAREDIAIQSFALSLQVVRPQSGPDSLNHHANDTCQ